MCQTHSYSPPSMIVQFAWNNFVFIFVVVRVVVDVVIVIVLLLLQLQFQIDDHFEIGHIFGDFPSVL